MCAVAVVGDGDDELEKQGRDRASAQRDSARGETRRLCTIGVTLENQPTTPSPHPLLRRSHRPPRRRPRRAQRRVPRPRRAHPASSSDTPLSSVPRGRLGSKYNNYVGRPNRDAGYCLVPPLPPHPIRVDVAHGHRRPVRCARARHGCRRHSQSLPRTGPPCLHGEAYHAQT